VIICVFLSVVSKVEGQSIGLQFGSTFINDKLLFKESDNNYRPFTFIGLNYQNKEVTTYVTYTFDLKIITIGSSIQLYKIKKNKFLNKH
jgi:hypothetical protein